ncbi:MAG: hypothetical protein ABI304_12160 [Rudaea sp.]
METREDLIDKQAATLESFSRRRCVDGRGKSVVRGELAVMPPANPKLSNCPAHGFATPITTKFQHQLRWAAALRRIGTIDPHEPLWLALALVFNLAWELAQLGFYDLSALHTSVAYGVVHCTLGDGIITVVAYLIAVGVTRSRTWPYTRPWVGMAVMLVSTVGYTALSEWRNVYLMHNWVYAASMPLIAGIGASPLLQWIVVPVAILITVRRFKP